MLRYFWQPYHPANEICAVRCYVELSDDERRYDQRFIGCIDQRRDSFLVRLRSVDLGQQRAPVKRSLAETLEQFVDSLGNGFVVRKQRTPGARPGARLIWEPMLLRTPNDLH